MLSRFLNHPPFKPWNWKFRFFENPDAILVGLSLFSSSSSPESPLVRSEPPTVHDQQQIFTLNKTIASCVRSGDIDGALRVFHGMRAKNTVTWNSLLVGISKDPNRTREAHQLFDEIPQPDTFSYNIILSCYVRNGDFDKARSFFDRTRRHGTR
ncbi:unnamed protein product [Microthlaspi erraticum]|uniref:Pentatricopeptide repeat-containing protein n=1 Tax=Microthlaspi erraticum TaxID=1685480 RepID=A0A6D2HVX1_9BRAS|nr:unnamed protein product [Microthlaspi erraticum]